MKRNRAIIAFIAAQLCGTAYAGTGPENPPFVADTYEISMGPAMDAIPGDPALLVPLNISVTSPTVRIYLDLLYDPVVLTPTLLAPNMFFQAFDYDISLPGRIRVSLQTDLPPPPEVPPILGDTTFAWISFRVTSADIGWDYLTHIFYYEDPFTPYPDNYIVLSDNNRITPPTLSLIQCDILILHPIYGDININGLPYEIGDAVVFMNYFMGETEFNRRQYANSDCNRDGAQATIADLVYLLRVITHDTIMAAPPLMWPQPEASLNPGAPQRDLGRCDIIVESEVALGGAAFEIIFNGNDIQPQAVMLDSAAAYMQLSYTIRDNRLLVTVVNWDAGNSSFAKGRLLSVLYSSAAGHSSKPFDIINADFSDNSGYSVDARYNAEYPHPGTPSAPVTSSMILKGYPNPFNCEVSISCEIPADGFYELSVYDILGRKVKTIFSGYQSAGQQAFVWNGTDKDNIGVSSGTYFLRLQGDIIAGSIKLFLLK